MKKLTLLLLLVLICGTSWASQQDEQIISEKEYWDKVNAIDLTFFVPESDLEAAWGRAQSWIGKYSSLKLQIATDYVLQTYNPTYWPQYGYYVTKEPIDGGANISVSCVALWHIFSRKAKEKNARILAYYIKTGKLPDFAIKEIRK